MSIIWRQAQATQTTSGLSISKSITPSSPGNIICAYASSNNTSNVFSISDTGGNSWNVLQAQATVGTSVQATWFMNTRNNNTITVNLTIPIAAFVCLIMDEFSGQASSPIDNKTTGSGSGTPSVSLTPVVNNCALWVATADTVTAPGSGFTKGGDDTAGDWSEWQILSGGGGTPQTCAFTGSGTYNMAAVSIAPRVITANVPSVVRSPAKPLTGKTTRYV